MEQQWEDTPKGDVVLTSAMRTQRQQAASRLEAAACHAHL